MTFTFKGKKNTIKAQQLQVNKFPVITLELITKTANLRALTLSEKINTLINK